MAKIVHVIKNMDMGGTAKTCQLFVRYLLQHTDHDVNVLFSLDGDRTRYDLFAKSMDIGSLLPFKDQESCEGLISSIEPDIVHVYRGGQPEWPFPSSNYKFVETNVFGFFDPDMDIDKTLYMSQWLHDAIKRELSIISRGIGGWGTRFNYINNPTLPPAHSGSFFARKDDGAIWLGRCGRPDDGIYDDISVKAAWLLRAKGHDIRFIVMAPPPRMIEDLNKYDIPHVVAGSTVNEDNLSHFYNAIDIYAHARADGETFGNNIAEAMYHGKPVVTHVAEPSHPGMGVFQSQTTLVSHGVSGFVSSHSIPEYADYLRNLIEDSDLRKSMGLAAHEEAKNRFDWRISGSKLCKMYEELLND